MQSHFLSSSRFDDPEHVRLARTFVGYTEKGNNKGSFIDELNGYVRNPKGSPYCQAFVSYILHKAGADSPDIRTGLATAVKTKYSYSAKKVISGKRHVQNGDILTWQKGKSIYGHAGFASENWNDASGMSIQANTSSNKEDRDGDGIFEKKAVIKPFSYFRIIRITPVKYKKKPAQPGYDEKCELKYAKVR